MQYFKWCNLPHYPFLPDAVSLVSLGNGPSSTPVLVIPCYVTNSHWFVDMVADSRHTAVSSWSTRTECQQSNRAGRSEYWYRVRLWSLWSVRSLHSSTIILGLWWLFQCKNRSTGLSRASILHCRCQQKIFHNLLSIAPNTALLLWVSTDAIVTNLLFEG